MATKPNLTKLIKPLSTKEFIAMFSPEAMPDDATFEELIQTEMLERVNKDDPNDDRLRLTKKGLQACELLFGTSENSDFIKN